MEFEERLVGQIRIWTVELQKGRNLRTKRQIRKLKAKIGFHVLAKHGLNKHGLKDQKLVSFGGETNP